MILSPDEILELKNVAKKYLYLNGEPISGKFSIKFGDIAIYFYLIGNIVIEKALIIKPWYLFDEEVRMIDDGPWWDTVRKNIPVVKAAIESKANEKNKREKDRIEKLKKEYK